MSRQARKELFGGMPGRKSFDYCANTSKLRAKPSEKPLVSHKKTQDAPIETKDGNDWAVVPDSRKKSRGKNNNTKRKESKLPNYFGVESKIDADMPPNRNYCANDNCITNESLKCEKSDDDKKKAFSCCSNIINNLPMLATIMSDKSELITRESLSIRILFILEYIEMALRLPIHSMHKFTRIPNPDPHNKGYRPLWRPPTDHKVVGGKVTPEIHTLSNNQWKLFFKLFAIQLVYLHKKLAETIYFVALPLHPKFVNMDSMAAAYKSGDHIPTDRSLRPKQWPHITIFSDEEQTNKEDPIDPIYLCYSWIFMLVKSGCLVMDENNFPVLEFKGIHTDPRQHVTHVKSANTSENGKCFSSYYPEFAKDVGRDGTKKLHVSYGTDENPLETKVIPKNGRVYVLPFLTGNYGIFSPVFEICTGIPLDTTIHEQHVKFMKARADENKTSTRSGEKKTGTGKWDKTVQWSRGKRPNKSTDRRRW